MDLDDSVRKLLRLGFENEQDVRAALKRTNLDVNQAITLLLTKRGSGCVGTLDASTIATVDQSCPSPGSDVSQIGGPYLTVEERPPIVGHDLCIEFSTAEFNCLQSRVYTDQWDIPCLRNQPLGKCIMGSIHMLRSVGLQALEDNSDCRQFVYICLSDCVTKLLNSQAVFNWDRETLEGVHNMLELAVRLICEYLAAFQRTLQSSMSAGSTAIDGGLAPSGCDEAVTTKLGLTTPRSAPAFTDWALHLLALIFDCEANYHQLCRDRSGSSGNYADPFNDWTSICQRRTTGSQAVYAEMLPSPRNFYLVNLVNCFGYFDGFRLLHWLGTQRWANISLMASVLSPLVHCADYLSAYTLRNERGLALMERALWRLSNLSEDDFKERDSKVFDLMTGLRVLTYRLIDLDLTGCLPFLTRSGATSGYQCPVEPDWESFEPSVTTSSSSSNGTSPSFAITQVDKLHCTLLLSALSPPQGAARASFNGRMLAMRNLVEQLEAAKLSADIEPMQTRSEGRGHGMRRVPFSQSSSATLLASENATFLLRRNRRRAIRFEFLMTWFRESEVILKSMHNLDNTAYMTTLGQLFRLLGERITPEDITTVWNRTTNQPGAAMDNVLTLITDVASSRFIQPQLHHLFHLVNQSWLHLNHQAHCQLSSAKSGQPITCSVISASTEASHIRHARARILSLIGRIGISTREAWKVDACVQLLWDLSNGTYSLHSSDAGHHLKSISTHVSAADKHSAVSERISAAAREYKHPEPIEAALAQQLVILREFRCSGNEQRLRAVRWLKSAIDNISHNSLTYFMLAYVKSLLELILRNFVGRTKRDYLNELIRTHDLIGQVISSLLRYEQWAMRSHGDLLSSDSLDELGFRHADVIKRHFDLLHYLLRNAEISLSVERAKALWENLIAHSHVTACDREQCFRWFTVSLNHLEPETQTMLFTKMVLKSNPALFRSYAGFEFFKALFEKVNLHEGRMKQVTKTWHVEKPDLIGLDFLWDLYLALPSSDASLDGVHMNPGSTAAQRVADHRHFGSPIDARALTNGAAERPTAGGTVVSTNQTDPSEYPTGGVEPNAVQLARQLLLDVHWGQLAPRLRRDPEGCYRRFFDSCRRRLECNLAVGRGPAPERGIQSALADTGRLLAAMVVGPGQARRATHCSQTAARLALRRLLGLVYAYIQTVEDELFGARSQHSNWRPHGATYRGWEMQLPLQVETLKPGQINPVPVTSTDGRLKSRSTFAPFIGPAPVGGGILDSSSSSHTVPLLIHSNEMLGSVRERANLIATALLFANRTSQDQCGAGSSAECTNWTTSALYLGPSHFHANGLVCAPGEKPDKSEPYSPFEAASAAVDDKCPLGERSHSKLLLEAVQNRKTVGDIGFETGRVLTVRLVYGLGSRVNSRAGRISVASHMGASSLMLSLGSAGPSVTSFVSRNPSDADLVNRASAALNATAPTQRSRHPISHMADTFMSALSLRKSKESSSVATNLGSSTNSLSTALSVPRGPSLTSLSSSLLPSSSVAAMSSTDLTAITGLAPATVPGHSLPSIYLGEDAGVYELLINLAESELTLSLPTSRSSSTEHKKLRSSVTIQPIGPSLLPSFSLIHPVRLLLATLPTYKSASISLSGNHLQQSLFCSPSNLLKSSPFRTLYKLQMLSSHLIPVDKTAWWDIFPGCLLSPPSQLYFATAVFSNSAIPSGRTSRSSVTSQSARAISQLNQLVYEGDSPRSCLSPTPTDTKIFLSTDLLGAEVIQSKLCSTSAPSSPILRRRRNFPTPIATTGSKTPTTSRSSRKNKSALQSAASLVAEVSPRRILGTTCSATSPALFYRVSRILLAPSIECTRLSRLLEDSIQ
ncbi:unnamed protein product [Dicrocoelium dendriticum]|nr:unnamed protein product [Dicrocoelium dendriticum]